jgi:hypothetical protein
MALEYRDRVSDTTTTTGTGSFTPAGSAATGFRTIAAAHTSGATVRYVCETSDKSEWEVGQGVWNGTTLTRATIYASSNSGNAVNFSSGTKTLMTAPIAADIGIDYGWPGFGLSSAATYEVQSFTLAAGANDVYTVPAGKRAFVSNVLISQTTGGALTIIPQLKASGSYYRLSTSQSLSSSATATTATIGVNNSYAPLYVFEAGESFALNSTGVATGLAYIVEFPDTDPLKSAKVLAAAGGGDRTIYTAPSNGAAILDNAFRFISQPGAFHITNGTGSGISVTPKLTSGSTTLSLTAQTGPANSKGTIAPFPTQLKSGDVVIATPASDLTGGLVWVNLVERP